MTNEWKDLELFDAKGFGRAGACEPIIRIGNNHQICMNKYFLEKSGNQVQQATVVHLNYSHKNNAIVFRFTKNPDKNSYDIKKSDEKSGSYVSVRSFATYFKISVKDLVGRYTPEKIHIPKVGQCWVIRLGEGRKLAAIKPYKRKVVRRTAAQILADNSKNTMKKHTTRKKATRKKAVRK